MEHRFPERGNIDITSTKSVLKKRRGNYVSHSIKLSKDSQTSLELSKSSKRKFEPRTLSSCAGLAVTTKRTTTPTQFSYKNRKFEFPEISKSHFSFFNFSENWRQGSRLSLEPPGHDGFGLQPPLLPSPICGLGSTFEQP